MQFRSPILTLAAVAAAALLVAPAAQAAGPRPLAGSA
jgi:hypothetical protein